MKNTQFTKRSALVIIFSMLVLMVCSVMKIDITNALTPILQEQEGWSRVSINSAVSIGGYIAIAVGFVGATIMLKKGIRFVSTPALILMAVASFMFAFCKSLTGVCVAYALGQAIYPVCLVSATSYVSKWFTKRRGWALGIATAALPITSSIYLSWGSGFIASQGRNVFYTAFGVIILIIAVLEFIMVKENPEDCGLTPDGIILSDEEKALVEKKRTEVGEFNLKTMLQKKEGWFLIIAVCGLRFMMVCLMSQMVSRMTDVGWARPQAANYMAIATLFGIGTSYLWGLLDDKITTPKACSIFGISYIVGFIFVLFNAPGKPVLLILVMMFLASVAGGQENLITSIVSYVYGRANYVRADRILRVTSNTASAFAYTFMTAIYASTESYDIAYIILAVMAAVTTFCYAMIRNSYDPERLAMNAASAK